MAANILLAVSAAIIGLLGLAHLLLTSWGPKLRPRDSSLEFVALAKLYWFSTPLAGASLSLLLYVVSIGIAWAA